MDDDYKAWFSMTSSTMTAARFQTLLEKAIDVRERALFPENPVLALPLTVQAEEITRHEQALLKCLLVQFNELFKVESLCNICAKRDECKYTGDDIGECSSYEADEKRGIE